MIGENDLGIVEDLKRETSDKLSIVLYQSSCRYHKSFQSIPFDAIVLCSNGFYRSERIGKVYRVKSDNNALLRALWEYDVKIRSAVFIRDGCCEGGNYECTNTATYFGRLLPILHDRFFVLTDHGTDAGFFDIPVHAEKIPAPEWCTLFIRQSAPIHECTFWEAEKIHESPKRIQIGNIALNICYDSVLGYLEKLDLVVIRSGNRAGFLHYFGLSEARNRTDNGQLFDRFLPYDFRGKTGYVKLASQRFRSLKGLLEFAARNGLHYIGLTPFARRRYGNVISELRHYDGPFQSEIFLFHLNRNDYARLYSYTG